MIVKSARASFTFQIQIVVDQILKQADFLLELFLFGLLLLLGFLVFGLKFL